MRLEFICKFIFQQQLLPGLHFKWGDAARFKCADKKICTKDGVIVEEHGKFLFSNPKKRNDQFIPGVGWYRGKVDGQNRPEGQGTMYYLNGDR